MNYNVISEDRFQKVTQSLTSWSSKGNLWIAGLVLVVLWGFYGFYKQVTVGHVVTGMRDNVVWGLFIVNFIFLIGIGYSGAILAGLLRLFRAEWRFPIVRISLIMAVVAGAIGPVFILLCIGRLDRLQFLFLYPRLQSPIVWDVLAVLTFLFGSALLLYLNSLPDFGFLKDSSLPLGKTKHRWYQRLAPGFLNTSEQHTKITKSSDTLALLLIPVSIIVSSILSWIFGMTLRPGWNSTIFGPYFVLASLFSGTAMVILLMWLFKKIYGLGDVITPTHFYKLGMLLIALGAGYGYFTFSEYFTEWYTSEKWNEELIYKLFSFNEYGAWTMVANVGGILVPLILIGIPALRKESTIVFSSILVLCALYIKRYLIVIPTLETTLLPIQDSRPEFVEYTATWVEWSLTFGGFAFFCLMITLLIRFIPIVPVWESKKEVKKSTILSIKTVTKSIEA